MNKIFTCQERKEEPLGVRAQEEKQAGARCVWGNGRKLGQRVWGRECEGGGSRVQQAQWLDSAFQIVVCGP